MKKRIAIVLSVCLLLCMTAMLSGCGEPAQQTAPAPAEEPAQQSQAAILPAPAEEMRPVVTETPDAPAEDAAQTPEDAGSADEAAEETPSVLETAKSFIDQDAQLLLDALGEPQERLYEASCSGPGDDGIWLYDGVTVFTYREGGVETIVDAEE